MLEKLVDMLLTPISFIGYYCSSVSSAPTKCASGDYSYAGATSSSSCATCPAGYACPAIDAIPEECPQGYYSANGSTDCRKCAAGKYCPKPDTETSITGTTTYSLEGATYATKVPPGYKFVSTSTLPVLCGAGTWWNSATAACALCSAGKFCPVDSNNVVSSAELTCPSGYYTDHTGATTCYLCPAGYSCSSVSATPSACTAG